MADGSNFHIPQALRDLDLGSFIGQSEPDLRRAVERAGGVLRVYRAGDGLTLDLRSNRVTARIEAGLVVEVHGIG